MGRRFDALDQLSKAAAIRPTLEARNEAIACLPLVDLRRAGTWAAPGKSFYGLDGRFERYALAVGDPKGTIRIRRATHHAELVTLPGFGEGLSFVIFSPNGRSIGAGYETCFCLWDGDRGEIIRRFPGGDPSEGADFSPDGRWLAAAAKDGSILLLDAVSGEEWKRLPPPPMPGWSARRLSFCPEGWMLAASSMDGRIWLYDVRSGKAFRKTEVPDLVEGMTWNRDGQVLAVACQDWKIHLWNVFDEGQPGTALEGHENAVTRVSFSHGGGLLASTSWDGTMRFWDTRTDLLLLTEPSVFVGTNVFAPDDGQVVLSRSPGEVQLFELASGDECAVLSTRGSRAIRGRVRELDISPDSRWMVLGGDDGVRIWDLATLREVAFLPLEGVHSAFFDERGESLITSWKGGVHRWPIERDPDGSRGEIRIGPSRAISKRKPSGICSPSSDRRFIVTTTEPNSPQGFLLEIDDPSKEVVLKGPQIEYATFSADARWIGTTAFRAEVVSIWNAKTGAHVRSVPAGFNSRGLFSPAGQWLVTRNEWDEYQLWDVNTWALVRRIQTEGVGKQGGPMVFTCDGKMLAVLKSPRAILLVDPDADREFATIESPDSSRIYDLRFSPDGTKLAAVLHAERVLVWDLRRVRARLASMGLDWDLPPFPPESPAQDPAPVPASPRPRAIERRGILHNPGFLGVAGLTEGNTKGDVPDGWRGFGVDQASGEIGVAPVAPAAIFPGSPATCAVRIRVASERGQMGFDHVNHRFAIAPSITYRARFYAKSGNRDGSDQGFAFAFLLYEGPLHGQRKRAGSEPKDPAELKAGAEWRLFATPAFENAEGTSGSLRFTVLDDGGENAILIALPEVEELVFPSDLSCSPEGTGVRLIWQNHAQNESLQVLRDGSGIANIAPDATTYLDPDPPKGERTYRVVAMICREPGGPSCTAEVREAE